MFDIEYICDATLSVIDRLVENSTKLATQRKMKEMASKRKEAYHKYLDPFLTLRNVSQPCNRMILSCMWQDEVVNCGSLFRAIETDYGLCCTFNTLPTSLLIKDQYAHILNYIDIELIDYLEILILHFSEDDREDLEEVLEWLAAELTYDNLIFTKGEYRPYPHRQLYPGRQAGLSIVLDPDLDEYKCTNTDSEGFMLGLNVPLDMPKMKDNAIPIRTGSEVYVGMRPEITLSDEAVKTFPLVSSNISFN